MIFRFLIDFQLEYNKPIVHVHVLLMSMCVPMYYSVLCNACREADKDMVVGGYRVPKGTVLSLPPYCLQLSPHNFIAAEKFWPGRWLKTSNTTVMVDPGEHKFCLHTTV